jgi:hypothetical protein
MRFIAGGNQQLHFAHLAHVEPLTAARALHEVIGLGFGDAIGIPASHDFAFGFRPNSAHLRDVVDAVCAAKKLSGFPDRGPAFKAALRSSISISVQSAPS